MRTFVAVEIKNEQLLSSLKKIQSEIQINAKPVEVNNLHFTLLFLGEISEEVSQKVKEVLEQIIFESFRIGFHGVGAFPNTRNPRVVWVGVKVGKEHLTNLAKVVEKKLTPLGFTSDMAFSPHVTIFRVKNRIGDISDKLKEFDLVEFGSEEVCEIKFKKSILTPQGPVYSDLQVVSAKK